MIAVQFQVSDQALSKMIFLLATLANLNFVLHFSLSGSGVGWSQKASKPRGVRL